MAAPRIVKPVKTRTVQKESAGLGGLGKMLGAGAGLAAAASLATPAAPLTVAGGLGAASTGASLGGLLGATVDPGQAGQAVQEQQAEVPGSRGLDTANNAQQILDGIRALEDFPDLADKYAKPLTAAYIQTQADLKQMG